MDALWGTIEPFASYAFNKSHAAGYALVSYWTAYMKANYTAEYMAALLDVGWRQERQVRDLPVGLPSPWHFGVAAGH